MIGTSITATSSEFNFTGDRLRSGFVIPDVHSDGINPPPQEKLLHSVTAANFLLADRLGLFEEENSADEGFGRWWLFLPETEGWWIDSVAIPRNKRPCHVIFFVMPHNIRLIGSVRRTNGDLNRERTTGAGTSTAAAHHPA
ncbi:hypothetical protein L1887_14882 [Cichorium endivia]|nr:hypothetical protein L1887_14882 [Cichorium endivia]